MLPSLDIGPLVLPTAPLVLISGIWLALFAVEKAAERVGAHVVWSYNLATYGLVAAFLAARIAFVALHWSAYRQNVLSIFWPLTSGYHLGAGLLVGLATAFFYGRARRLPAGETLDALAPGLLVAAIALSLADFLAGPGYGKEAALPWSITLFGIARHPVQLYEIAGALAALAVWHLYSKKRHFAGQLFLLAAVVFSAGRLVLDAFRANAPLTADGYHIVQIVALFVITGCLFVLMQKVAGNAPETPSETS